MLHIENYGEKVKYIHTKKQNSQVIHSSWLQKHFHSIALLGFFRGTVAITSLWENINITLWGKKISWKIKLKAKGPECGYYLKETDNANRTW